MPSIFRQLLLTGIILVGAATFLAQTGGSSNPAFPTSKTDKNKKRHSATIKRTFANAEEEALLRIAETTNPSEAEIIQNCDTESGNPAGIKPTGPRWWCRGFDGVYMPYAVTKAAVEYYLTVTDNFRQGDFTRTHKLRMQNTAFSYSAEINHRSKVLVLDRAFTDVYQVELSLSWSQYCGNLCAMATSAKRTVVLDKKGVILFISGDGDAQGMIS